MKEYPDQPEEQEPIESNDNSSMNKMRKIIKEILEEELPTCSTNDWFLESIYFDAMLDKMMGEVWENV